MNNKYNPEKATEQLETYKQYLQLGKELAQTTIESLAAKFEMSEYSIRALIRADIPTAELLQAVIIDRKETIAVREKLRKKLMNVNLTELIEKTKRH